MKVVHKVINTNNTNTILKQLFSVTIRSQRLGNYGSLGYCAGLSLFVYCKFPKNVNKITSHMSP